MFWPGIIQVSSQDPSNFSAVVLYTQSDWSVPHWPNFTYQKISSRWIIHAPHSASENLNSDATEGTASQCRPKEPLKPFPHIPSFEPSQPGLPWLKGQTGKMPFPFHLLLFRAEWHCLPHNQLNRKSWFRVSSRNKGQGWSSKNMNDVSKHIYNLWLAAFPVAKTQKHKLEYLSIHSFSILAQPPPDISLLLSAPKWLHH